MEMQEAAGLALYIPTHDDEAVMDGAPDRWWLVEEQRIPSPSASLRVRNGNAGVLDGDTGGVSGVVGEDFGPGVGDFGAEAGGVALGGFVDLLDLAGEVGRGRGDGDDAEGGAVPDDAVVQLGDGEVEAVAEFVLEGADDLAAVLEGLGIGDFDFEGKAGDGHVMTLKFDESRAGLQR